MTDEQQHQHQQVRLGLTVVEAAKVLGISRSLAYQLAASGDLPTVRLGRRLVVPRKALERLLEVDGSSHAAS